MIKRMLLCLYDFAWDIFMAFRELWFVKMTRMPCVMSLEETLRYVVENRCSVARFGDGEMKFIEGEGTSFQHYDAKLGVRLMEILRGGESKNLLVCIPGVFGSLKEYADEYKTYWKQYLLRNRHVWYKNVNKKYVYGEAFISRCYLTYKVKSKAKEYFNMWKRIWDGRDILVVEGEKTRLGVGNDLFDNVKSIKRILAPNMEAFALYDRIMAEVRNNARNHLILLALGPTATVLSADLSEEGFQAIDLGHIDIEYEWMRMKATTRVAVSGKFVNEAANGRKVCDCLDNDYLAQIVKVIN